MRDTTDMRNQWCIPDNKKRAHMGPVFVIVSPIACLFGPTLVRDPILLRALAEARLAVDVMDSKAAARTYNVLVSEGRRVAVALLPI